MNIETVSHCEHVHPRRGLILPLVLVITVLLSLLAISFSFSTGAQLKASTTQTHYSQASQAARSGIEAAAQVVRDFGDDELEWFDKEERFKNMPVRDLFDQQEETSERQWYYSLVAPKLEIQEGLQEEDERVRYGLTDEASKLNLNVISRNVLLRLPHVTEELAAALIDWRDTDSTPEENGAENEYYSSLEIPYSCKNAPLDTVEELLMVRGFTGQVLYGEDMNRNGVLDTNEDDGDESFPPDNADGTLDTGLYPLVTVYSKELNITDSDALTPRININAESTQLLQGQLQQRFRPEIVDFIMQVRQRGKFEILSVASLYQLTAKAGTTTLTSPLTVSDMPAVMDYLTVRPETSVWGLVNINTAPRPVLEAMGLFRQQEIDNILATRTRLDAETRKTIAWLLTEQVLSARQFRRAAPRLTAKSVQFRAECIGYSADLPIQARLEAVFELRGPRVQYLYWRDLASLGLAYRMDDIEEDTVLK